MNRSPSTQPGLHPAAPQAPHTAVAGRSSSGDALASPAASPGDERQPPSSAAAWACISTAAADSAARWAGVRSGSPCLLCVLCVLCLHLCCLCLCLAVIYTKADLLSNPPVT